MKKFKLHDVLLIVDPQNDFMPTGALGVPQGDEIISLVNQWIAAAQAAHVPIIISRDWHPPHHISFIERGGPWPVHCVQNTKGAEFHKDLALPSNAIIVDKAFLVDKEAYSAFEGVTHDSKMPLPDQLQSLQAHRVWIAGLALDYCVYYSALSANQLGLEFHIILPACRAISPETGNKALEHMKKLGGTIIETDVDP